MQTQGFKITGNEIDKLIPLIRDSFEPAFFVRSHSEKTFLFTAENYSFWQESDMAITIFLDIADANTCQGVLIVSGGKQGLFRLDLFGRENSRLNRFLGKLQDVCQKQNYKLEFVHNE